MEEVRGILTKMLFKRIEVKYLDKPDPVICKPYAIDYDENYFYDHDSDDDEGLPMRGITSIEQVKEKW